MRRVATVNLSHGSSRGRNALMAEVGIRYQSMIRALVAEMS
jgi:hypothetical protein